MNYLIISKHPNNVFWGMAQARDAEHAAALYYRNTGSGRICIVLQVSENYGWQVVADQCGENICNG